MRIAIYLRLSRESDDSASLETQRQAAQRWLLANGYDPADAVEYPDAGVSGAKPLEAREQMGALMASRPDLVIAWKLDRYARSVSEFLRLVAWGEHYGVKIATTDGTINTLTPTGRMVAVVLAALAEWEREMIKDRITEGHATRRQQGRWASGRAPRGYRIVRRDDAAYLEVHPEEASAIREAMTALVNAGTVAGTARIVGVSEPQWRRLLKAPTLRGQRAHKGELITAADGVTPVQFADPILSAAELKAARDRMEALATGKNRAPRRATPMCSDMSVCYRGCKLNGGTSDKGVPLYRCKAGHTTIYAETLDQRVRDEFLKVFGGMREVLIHLEGGNDLSADMEEIQEQADRVAERMATAGMLMLPTLERKAKELEDAYTRLLAAHDPETREVAVPTGRTMGQAWEAEDMAGRRRLLTLANLRVTLHPREAADRLTVEWGPEPEDVAEAELAAIARIEGEAPARRVDLLTPEQHEEIRRDLLADVARQEAS
ncbi:recombinase family protein [Streptomyces sp. NBC_01264]|uniref:recombinase family protein n=1 Tax=Streptomyces sp. NBC_01264 TaxID=2903804 RepID=UPI0022528769|nr:recombinase family protein [Streptomyces sp. NBC_01264]MCX4781113.1 recombinase family protein [Streptomyces sp. NBC_01264]